MHLSVALRIFLSLALSSLLLALVGELCYLLWWKRQQRTSCTRVNEENHKSHAQELLHLFFSDKPSSSIRHQSSQRILTNSEPDTNDPDVESCSSEDFTFGEDDVEPESTQNLLCDLVCTPGFLFTIDEESNEDLESDDGESMGDRRCRQGGSSARSLSDQFVVLGVESPAVKGSAAAAAAAAALTRFNPLFEAEPHGLISSPPSKFKFLRDADEKLYRTLLEENSAGAAEMIKAAGTESSHCDEYQLHDRRQQYRASSSQVLPLASSPVSFSFTHVESSSGTSSFLSRVTLLG